MIRSAFEILSWYLSPRRLPWFAVAEFVIMVGAVIAYELSSHATVWIFIASAASGFGTYMAAHHYADLGRHPETKRERERLEREFAERWNRMSPAMQERYRQMGRNLATLARAGTVDMETAARNMQQAFAASPRASTR